MHSMKIFRSEQIRQLDALTIQNAPVSSIDLMERAAGKIFRWITERFDRSRTIFILIGPGNNGGDGLALARMLFLHGYTVEPCYISFAARTTAEWEINRKRLEESGVILKIVKEPDQIPFLTSESIVVDAIFGSGLTRPVEGLAAEIIRMINGSGALTVAIDVPTGLFCEDNSGNIPENIIRADHTLTFQFPKIAFMFADNAQFTGEWQVLDIGLHEATIRNTLTSYYYVDRQHVKPLLKNRNKFDHKGRFGHGLLIAGSYGKMGAAVLSARACMKTGIGLTTCHIPSCGYTIMQTAVPEAMAVTDASEYFISDAGETGKFDAIAIGPGIGTGKVTQEAMGKFLKDCTRPLVIDADALNILSMNRDLMQYLPEGSILTPHPGEFDRLAGKSESGYERMMKQVKLSADFKCIVVLKGANTSISMPDGKVLFNSTGNPGMATGGSGDVLTGMLLSLLAQGYDAADASVAGVYLHGLAGDIAAGEASYESIIASDIINSIGTAFKMVRTEKEYKV